MIITLVDTEFKPSFSDNTYFFEVDSSKSELNPIKKSKTCREYRITLNYKEITVCCPVFKDVNKNSIVYIPSYILPHRGYPVSVYLYAIALYLSSKLSMRATAAEVKRKFGLETFSHSTISRTLSRISENIHHITVVHNADFTHPTLRTDRAWEEITRAKYLKVLIFLNTLLNENEFTNGSKVNYDYFRRTKRFII